MSEIGMFSARLSATASRVPASTSRTAGVTRRVPSLRSELKNPGPTCSPSA